LLQVIDRGTIEQETAILIRESNFHLQNLGCKNGIPILVFKDSNPRQFKSAFQVLRNAQE